MVEARFELISITAHLLLFPWSGLSTLAHPHPSRGLLLQCPLRMQGASVHLHLALPPILSCQLLEDRCQVWPFAPSTSPGCSLSFPPAATASLVTQVALPRGQGPGALFCIRCPRKTTSPSSHLQGTPRKGGVGGRRGEGAKGRVEQEDALN